MRAVQSARKIDWASVVAFSHAMVSEFDGSRIFFWLRKKLDLIAFQLFDQTGDLRQNRGSFMGEPDLRTRIKEMLVKNLMLQVTPDQIGDDLPLFGANGLGLDSIDALELVVSMEKTFGVGVPSSEVAGKALQTVNTIHDYILEKRSKAA